MLQKLESVQTEALEALAGVSDEEGLQAWRVAHIGRSSPVMDVFKSMGTLSAEERPKVGQQANRVKQALEAAFEEKALALKQAAIQDSLEGERLDVTMPGRTQVRGRLHPVTQTIRQISDIFAEMGFQVYRSREVETDEMNFQLLNFPPHHPARDMQDTFFTTKEGVILRTHTSPGQVRAMGEYAATNPENPPPVRVILPGMCYRYEQVTARSEMQFNQVEGLAVGHNITLGDLKGTLTNFARRFFSENVRTRFRSAYFPFTEPSAEMDIECFVCSGEGCPVCKHTGWLEILGSGMVHPTVLRNGGYDPEKYSGFAFGMGPERITMLKYRIEDIRNFWRNDMRFLEQF